MGRWRAVCFDLFGTLVAPFPRASHSEVLEFCAELIGVAFAEVDAHMGDHYQARVRGTAGDVADQLLALPAIAGRPVEGSWRAQISDRYRKWAAGALSPLPGAVELLEGLRGAGLSLALVTNVSPDVVAVWPGSPLASRLDHLAFSCEVGAVKPDPEIYRSALEALGAAPSEVLFVGDGSDHELQGACRVGIEGLLVRADRSDTYDSDLYDRLDWDGPVVESLDEVAAFVMA